eukprot:3729492-Rhodomonas_salina.3
MEHVLEVPVLQRFQHLRCHCSPNGNWIRLLPVRLAGGARPTRVPSNLSRYPCHGTRGGTEMLRRT